MIRLGFSVELHYTVGSPAADFIFNVQAAHTRLPRHTAGALSTDSGETST